MHRRRNRAWTLTSRTSFPDPSRSRIMKWRNPEAAGRMAERRKRETEAPRLATMVPTLEKLRLEVQEHSSSISRPEHTHTRHVVVASAPALFVLPCHDTQCKD